MKLDMELSRETRIVAGLTLLTVPVAAIAISGGFFGVAFVPAFRWLLYLGAASLAIAVVLTGVGLLRRPKLQTRS